MPGEKKWHFKNSSAHIYANTFLSKCGLSSVSKADTHAFDRPLSNCNQEQERSMPRTSEVFVKKQEQSWSSLTWQGRLSGTWASHLKAPWNVSWFFLEPLQCTHQFGDYKSLRFSNGEQTGNYEMASHRRKKLGPPLGTTYVISVNSQQLPYKVVIFIFQTKAHDGCIICSEDYIP